MSPEVRNKAKQNFFGAFRTPEVRSNLFKRAMDSSKGNQSNIGTTISQNFLYFIQEKITYFEVLLSEDMTNLDKVQRDAIYDRIISGCLEALSDSFDTFAKCKQGQNPASWGDENTQEYISQIVDVLGLDSNDYPTIYKFLGAKFSPQIRAAALKLLERMSDYMISFDPENKAIFDKHIHKLANSIFSAIADQSAQVQRQLWKTVLYNFSKKFEDTIWSQIDIKKGLLPQLHTCLKNSGFGAHNDLYQNFVAFVSIMPLFALHEPFESTARIESSKGNKSIAESKEETKGEADPQEKPDKSNKKKNKAKNKNPEGPTEKVVKNSFSANEKLNIMFEIMKSLFQGLSVEEAIAFCDEVSDSYYDTMSFIYLKRVLPAIEHFTANNDEKSLSNLHKKVTQ